MFDQFSYKQSNAQNNLAFLRPSPVFTRKESVTVLSASHTATRFILLQFQGRSCTVQQEKLSNTLRNFEKSVGPFLHCSSLEQLSVTLEAK